MEIYFQLSGGAEEGQKWFCNSCFSSLLNSEQSLCYSGVLWGELPCTPSGAQITWCLPVLMQGADAGPGGGLPACRPCDLGPFPRAHLLSFPRTVSITDAAFW